MTTATKHPLIGSGLHYVEADGYTQNQAYVVDVLQSVQGDVLVVEYFEWLMGDRTSRRLLLLTELATKNWVLFKSVEDMNEYYEKYAEPRNRRILKQRVEGNFEPVLREVPDTDGFRTAVRNTMDTMYLIRLWFSDRGIEATVTELVALTELIDRYAARVVRRREDEN